MTRTGDAHSSNSLSGMMTGQILGGFPSRREREPAPTFPGFNPDIERISRPDSLGVGAIQTELDLDPRRRAFRPESAPAPDPELIPVWGSCFFKNTDSWTWPEL
jgi:hypothetical protein